MTRFQYEIKIFHFFNGVTWVVAFLLFIITQQAKPQDIDMFNYGIKNQISQNWDTDLLGVGKWFLLSLCIVCSISFLSNVIMSLDTDKKFSITQLIVTVVTIWYTVFYFSNFGF